MLCSHCRLTSSFFSEGGQKVFGEECQQRGKPGVSRQCSVFVWGAAKLTAWLDSCVSLFVSLSFRPEVLWRFFQAVMPSPGLTVIPHTHNNSCLAFISTNSPLCFEVDVILQSWCIITNESKCSPSVYIEFILSATFFFFYIQPITLVAKKTEMVLSVTTSSHHCKKY